MRTCVKVKSTRVSQARACSMTPTTDFMVCTFFAFAWAQTIRRHQFNPQFDALIVHLLTKCLIFLSHSFQFAFRKHFGASGCSHASKLLIDLLFGATSTPSYSLYYCCKYHTYTLFFYVLHLLSHSMLTYTTHVNVVKTKSLYK